MHDEDTCCVDGCSEPVHVRRSRKYPHLSGACKYHYFAEASYRPAEKPGIRECLWCRSEFQPSRADHRCCKKDCATLWSVHGRPRFTPETRACERCGEDFTARTPSHRFCSSRCAMRPPGRVCVECGVTFWRTSRTSVCGPCAAARKAARAVLVAEREAARLIRPVLVPGRRRTPVGPFVAASCPECLVPFVMTASHARMGATDGVRYCSLACGERASRRAYRHRRRVRHGGQRIYRARVFERDGWLCRLCGEPLDRDAAVPDPMAPVVDHIVPLALGGEHAHYNVQAAHFICNSHKRDLLDGQVAMPV